MQVPKTPFILEMCAVIARHMKAQYGWETDAEYIHSCAREYDQIPCQFWDALAYLKERNFYRSLDEVENPVEGMRVSIREPKSLTDYRYHKGQWVYTGDIISKY